jgi:hypothetical protein
MISLLAAAVMPTPISDQISLSVLFDDKPGNHISWHYDHNFYRGRHFPVLPPPLVNQGHAPNGLSHAQLISSLARRIAARPRRAIC